MKGGQSLNLCATCVKEAEEQQMKWEEKFERERQKFEIKAKTMALKNQELARLAKIRLKHEEELLSLSPSDFEDAVAVLYRQLGYSVEQTPYSGDFGKDLVAIKDGIKYLIECKRYQPDKRIGRPPLQNFLQQW